MKKILLLFTLFFFLTAISKAQEMISRHWTSITQNIDVSMYENKKFKLSAAIKKETFNGNEWASVWARVDKSDGTYGFFSNPYKEMEVTGNWKRFNIEGTVDKDGKKLVFGLFCMNNGKFFFDDVQLEIQNERGQWISMTLKNPDFENVPKDKELIWGDLTTSTIKQFSASVITENPYSGKYALMITGKGIYGQSDDKGGFTEANGIKFYYEIYGEGEPLLLIHGNGQSISAFQNQIEYFSKKYKVIAVDSRGRGRSEDNDEELTYVIQATDMKLFLDNLKIDAAHIIGWSDGGIIGLLWLWQIKSVKFSFFSWICSYIHRIIRFSGFDHGKEDPEHLISHIVHHQEKMFSFHDFSLPVKLKLLIGSAHIQSRQIHQ